MIQTLHAKLNFVSQVGNTTLAFAKYSTMFSTDLNI